MTIIFRLFTLSAIIPPIGVIRIIGINAHADTTPNNEADPVLFKRYNGNAKRNIVLPNSEIICPINTIIKFLLNNFILNLTSLLFFYILIISGNFLK